MTGRPFLTKLKNDFMNFWVKRNLYFRVQHTQFNNKSLKPKVVIGLYFLSKCLMSLSSITAFNVTASTITTTNFFITFTSIDLPGYV